MSNKDWKQKFKDRIEELKQNQQEFQDSIKDQVKRDIINPQRIIDWGRQMGKLQDTIEFHENMMEKFIRETENKDSDEDL